MKVARLLCAVAAVALAAAPAAAARPASPQTDFKVLHVVATGFGVELTPTSVHAARYTVQVHNTGQYTVRLTIGHLVDVIVKPGGWQFRDAEFKAGTTYQVHAVAPVGHLTWGTAVTTSQ